VEAVQRHEDLHTPQATILDLRTRVVGGKGASQRFDMSLATMTNVFS